MSKSAPESRPPPQASSRQRQGRGRLAAVLPALLLLAQFAAPQRCLAAEFMRIPAGKSFEARFMPFKWATPLESPGVMGTAPWITLQYADSPGTTHLEVAALRLHVAAPRESKAETRSGRPGAEPRPMTAQDVRVRWTYRRLFTAWLGAEPVTESLAESIRKQLAQRGALPAGARITALANGTYAEIRTDTDGATSVALKTAQGKPVTPEAPAPTWVEPLIHQVFVACVEASGAAEPPLRDAILGKRHETRRRCGLMNAEGRWLAKPEFEFMEDIGETIVSGYPSDGPVLLLRGNEPCVATMHVPVAVACLGQPFSALFSGDRLAFAAASPDNPRHGGPALGYLSPDGDWAIPPDFHSAQPFHGNIAAVERAGVEGIIDRSGRWLTPRPPDDPVAARWLGAMRDGPKQVYGFGVIDHDGLLVIPTMFLNIERIDNTHFHACHGGRCDAIEVPDLPAPPAVKPIKGKTAAATVASAARWVPAAENGKWGYQDADGRWMLKPRFEDAEAFDGGMAKAKSDGFWGIIMPSGKWLFDPLAHHISPPTYGVAIAHPGEREPLLLRADGKSISFTEGLVRTPFGADGLAVAHSARNDKVGFIDRNSDWAILPRYASAQPFSGAYAIVSGYLPETWRPPNFNEPPYILRGIHWLAPHVVALRAWVGQEERIGLMDTDGNWLVPAP